MIEISRLLAPRAFETSIFIQMTCRVGFTLEESNTTAGAFELRPPCRALSPDAKNRRFLEVAGLKTREFNQ